MTASVGVGRASDDDKAKKHIEKVMANMDAETIVTVTENIMELRKYVNIPKQSISSEKHKWLKHLKCQRDISPCFGFQTYLQALHVPACAWIDK